MIYMSHTTDPYTSTKQLWKRTESDKIAENHHGLILVGRSCLRQIILWL